MNKVSCFDAIFPLSPWCVDWVSQENLDKNYVYFSASSEVAVGGPDDAPVDEAEQPETNPTPDAGISKSLGGIFTSIASLRRRDDDAQSRAAPGQRACLAHNTSTRPMSKCTPYHAMPCDAMRLMHLQCNSSKTPANAELHSYHRPRDHALSPETLSFPQICPSAHRIRIRIPTHERFLRRYPR